MMTEKKEDGINNIVKSMAGEGISTGYERIDELTAGLHKPDLIIIAGRPCTGKTALTLNIAAYVAMVEGIPVAILSMEETKERLALRILASQARVNSVRLRSGNLSETELEKLKRVSDKISRAPLFIDDTPALTIQELQRKARGVKAEHGLGLVVIDYLQIMRSEAYKQGRDAEISEITRELKALGKEIDVPIIAISQIDRKVEERYDRHPMLSDLSESGAIENDADVIIFIYRDEIYNRADDNPTKGVAEIIIAKQRNGPTGMVKLAFMEDYGCFENLSGNRYR